MKKSFIAILLTCSMLLVGCGSKSSSESEQITQETTTTTTTTETTTTVTTTATTTTITTTTTTVATEAATEPPTVEIIQTQPTVAEPVVVYVEVPQEVPTAAPPVEPETQTEDHSREIAQLESKIATCNSYIETYKNNINRKELLVSDYTNTLKTVKKDLEIAQVALENAQNNKVRVYDASRGWTDMPDAAKVAAAERDVEFEQGRVDSYQLYIDAYNKEIEEYHI